MKRVLLDTKFGELMKRLDKEERMHCDTTSGLPQNYQ